MQQDAKVPKGRRPTADERIDESLDESFPASDPPAHGGVVVGGPRRDKKGGRGKDPDQAKR